MVKVRVRLGSGGRRSKSEKGDARYAQHALGGV